MLIYVYIDGHQYISMEKDNGPDRVRHEVSEYYGHGLKSTKDLRTGACMCGCGPSEEVRRVLPLIDDEILDRFYGCGSPLPPMLEGLTVLDLGCGTGRDVYIASKLVESGGHVIGVDMTPEQIEVAEKHINDQTERFGYSSPNVDFRLGTIEDLRSLGIADSSVDVVISNCVINLSPEKEKVFSEVRRVLRDGGELYFSDVFADRRVPDSVRDDPVIRGECLGGAMYWGDFRRMMRKAGFEDVRAVTSSPIAIDDGTIASAVGDIRFRSVTVRAFKLPDLEDDCEDYGQTAVYNGTVQGHPDRFDLDGGHGFPKGVPVRVCGNTASMLSRTRYSKAFTVNGGRDTHHGRFEGCGGDDGIPCTCGCCRPDTSSTGP